MHSQTSQKAELFVHAFRMVILGVFVVFAFVLTSLIFTPETTVAATSSTVNFQARLETSAGAIAPDGYYNVTFHLFKASTATGGTSTDTGCGTDTSCEWVEQYTYNSGAGSTDARVRVVNGYLTVNLGSLNAFSGINWNQQQWLTMDIGGTAGSGTISWDGQMNPRLLMTASPYAFQAGALTQTDGSGNTGKLSFGTTANNPNLTLPDVASGTVCLQNSSACGFATGSGTAFLQGGNSFGVQGVLGTNDGNSLAVRTGGANRLVIDTSGNLQLQQTSTFNIASATTGTQLTIKGGDATSGTNAGGSLLLQGGAGATTGASGSVVVKSNTNNSTTAFQLQSASAGVLFNADTTNMRLGVNATYSQMSAPSGLAKTNTTGSLTAGNTFRYEVTALDGAGGETTVSNELSGVTGATGYNLTWTAVTGATAYRVYRTANGGASGTEKYLATTLTNSYTDNGSISLSTIVIPTTNTAYVATNVSNGSLQLAIGGNGTPTGQLYVSSTVPSSRLGYARLNGAATYDGIFVQGNNIYLKTDAGFDIVDTSNPNNPTVIGGNTGLSGGVGALYVQGHYLYTTEAFNNKFDVFDVTNPASPTIAGQLSGIGAAQHANPVAVAGRYAYVGDNTTGNLDVIDVSNPNKPALATTITLSGAAVAVAVQGNYLYVDSGTILTTFDISNPLAPVTKSIYTVAANSRNMVVSGRYAYITGYWNNLVTIVDISNPSNPVAVSSTALTNPDAIAVQGRFAYILQTGSSPGTMVTWDISNPAQPRQVGSTTLTGNDLNFPDIIAAQGRYVFVTDKPNEALNVYDVGGTYSQSLEAGTAVVGSLQVSTNANISGSANVQSTLSVGGNAKVDGSLGVGGTITATSNSSSLGTPQMKIIQGGTGDASLLFSGPSISWAVGQDANNSNSFTINSSTANAAGTSQTLGRTGPGASTDSGDNNSMECSNYTTGTGAAITTIALKTGSVDGTNRSYSMAIYYDNGGVPGAKVANTATGTLSGTPGANSLAITATLYDNTTYWLCANTNGAGTGWSYDSSVAGVNDYFAAQTFGTWPSTFPTGTLTAGNALAFSITYTAANVFANPMLSISQNGQVKLRNFSNSTSAFQIQNATGSNLFTADTTNGNIVLGNDGTPSALTVRGGAATGTNSSGANLTFAASNGTGTANSGDIIFQTATGTNAVTVDTNSSTQSSSVASISWNHTVGANSNMILIVSIGDTLGQTVSSVTYNGVALTKLASVDCATVCHEEMWYLVNPASGTHSIAVTFSASTSSVAVGATSYYNVNTTTPFGTAATNTNSSTAASVTISTTSGQLAVDAAVTRSGTTLTANSPQTQQWNIANTGNRVEASSTLPVSGTSTTMGWTVGTSTNWGEIGVGINPATTSSTTDTLTDRLHITAAGSVGINTSNPQYTLDVAGTARIQTTTNSITGFQVQNASSGSVLDVDTVNGFVGVGTSTPATNLDVQNASGNNTGTYAFQVKQFNASSYGAYIFANSNSSTIDALNVQGWNGTSVINGLDVKTNGNVGFNTTSPNQLLTVNGNGALWNGGQFYLYDDSGSTQRGYMGGGRNGDLAVVSKETGKELRIGTAGNIGFWMDGNADSTDSPGIIFANKPETLNTGWNGANSLSYFGKYSTSGRSINAAGSINSNGADYAEYFYQQSPGILQKGDLVTLSGSGKAEKGAAGEQIVGVVSIQAGFVGNDLYDSNNPGATALVGLIGQIPTKVSTENGAIAVGDALAASPDKPGVAVKQDGSGAIVGYALESYANSNPNTIGTAMVLVRPGWSASDTDMGQLSSLTSSINALQSQVDSLSAQLNSLTGQVPYLSQPNTFNGTSTNQMVIQDASGNVLFTADTQHMVVTVASLTVTGTLAVNGHIVTSGNVPAVAAGSAACTTPTVSITGTDTAGTITITTGTQCANSGQLAVITFNHAYTAAPQVVLTAANPASALLPIYRTTSETGFTLSTPNKPISATTYVFSYFTAQ